MAELWSYCEGSSSLRSHPQIAVNQTSFYATDVLLADACGLVEGAVVNLYLLVAVRSTKRKLMLSGSINNARDTVLIHDFVVVVLV